MNRREFMASAAAAPIVATLPSPVAALVRAPGRWYAVGNDEFCYPFWAASRKDAAIQYAVEWGARLGDDCPECGKVDCAEHLEPGSFDEPQAWVDVHEPRNWVDIPANRDPTNIEWLEAGFNVPCAHCQDEPTECTAFDGETLCADCFHEARHRKLFEIIGYTAKCDCGRWCGPH